MRECKCGNTTFKSKMVTIADVLVTSKSGCPELISGSEDVQSNDFKGSFVCEKCGEVYLDIEDCESDACVTRRCECGSTRFTAHQICRHDVIVDSDNQYQRDDGIYDAERPYGPYICTQCNREYEELDELPVIPTAASAGSVPAFEQHKITQEPKHSLYLGWDELSDLSSSLISDLLGRKAKVEAMREEFYDMYLFLKEPIAFSEMEALYEVVQASDDDREEFMHEEGEPIQKIEQGVSQKLIGKLLPFNLVLTHADEEGVWFIGDSR